MIDTNQVNVSLQFEIINNLSSFISLEVCPLL